MAAGRVDSLVDWRHGGRPRFCAAADPCRLWLRVALGPQPFSSKAAYRLASAVVLPLVAFTKLLPPTPPHMGLAFVCIPALMWAVFRFAQREVAFSTLLISGIGIWGALQHGLIAGELPRGRVLLELQLYMGTMSLMFLAVAAEVEPRRRQEAALERAAEALREQARIVESSGDAILSKNLDGVILELERRSGKAVRIRSCGGRRPPRFHPFPARARKRVDAVFATPRTRRGD